MMGNKGPPRLIMLEPFCLALETRLLFPESEWVPSWDATRGVSRERTRSPRARADSGQKRRRKIGGLGPLGRVVGLRS
jgi:hypothetical protein